MRRSVVLSCLVVVGVVLALAMARSRAPVQPPAPAESPTLTQSSASAQTPAPEVPAQSTAALESPAPVQSAAPSAAPAETQTAAPAATPAEAPAATPAQAESPAPATTPAQAEAPAAAPSPAQAETAAPAKAAQVAQSCPGNPNAIGTSRTITVNPADLPLIGTIQYRATLPLKDHEVVLTFDDGPIPPYTTTILDILASQCVKATYFLVGEMAHARPYLVRRIYNEGHSVGTHSQNHPSAFQNLSMQRVERQVAGGIDSVDYALGDPKAISPFFRIPGLGRTNAIEHFLEGKGLMTWSVDIDTNDWWRGSSPGAIVQRAMRQLSAKGKGIVLMHDIHPATVMALPLLLKELKANGYRIVHVEAAGERPKSLPELPAVTDTGNWPKVIKVSASSEDKAVKTVHARTRVAHHRSARSRVAHNERDPDITASISKKKSKAQTAQSDSWMSLQR